MRSRGPATIPAFWGNFASIPFAAWSGGPKLARVGRQYRQRRPPRAKRTGLSCSPRPFRCPGLAGSSPSTAAITSASPSTPTHGLDMWPELSPSARRRHHRLPRNPMRVEGLRGIAAIATGEVHTLALGRDATVWAWGRNDRGQLGTATTDLCYKGVPVQPNARPGHGPHPRRRHGRRRNHNDPQVADRAPCALSKTSQVNLKAAQVRTKFSLPGLLEASQVNLKAAQVRTKFSLPGLLNASW